MKKKRLHLSTTLIAAMALTLFLPIQTFAQDDGPTWAQVRVVQVKTGKNGDFADLQKELTAALKAANRPTRAVYQEIRGAIGTFYVLEPDVDPVDFDTPFVPPMSDDQWAAWLSRYGDTVDLSTLMTMRYYAELSIAGDDDAAPNLFFLRYRTAAPGNSGAYADWVRDYLSPALKKGGAKNINYYRIQTGGNNNTWISGTAHTSWAAMSSFNPLNHMSTKDRDAMLAAGNALLVETENRIIRYRADLSE